MLREQNPRRISPDGLKRMAIVTTVAPTADSLADDAVSAETALACLFWRDAQNGVYAEIGAVRRRNLIEGDTLPASRLVELAGEFGLRAERARFDWDGLSTTPFGQLGAAMRWSSLRCRLARPRRSSASPGSRASCSPSAA